MSQPISREEFTAFTTRLYETIDDGFAGTHRRLDALNGRIGKNEVDIAAHEVRLDTLDESHLHRRVTDATPAAGGQSFTRREKTLATLGLGLLVGIAKVALMAGQFAIEFGKAAIHK